MQTNLAQTVKARPEHQELETILRSCVHCGFCTATCPTYQLLGDELDGPRGRIYLLKQMLEGRPVSRLTQGHLDRCLTCRACETTCPSGVRYGRLLDIGRAMVDDQVGRPLPEKLQRWLMGRIFPYQHRFKKVMQLARIFNTLLPAGIRQKIPEQSGQSDWPEARHRRKMLILPGCVQPVLRPAIDRATAKVLDRLGISLLQVKAAGCCGALNYHLTQHSRAKAFAKNNIDACWPYIEQGAEAIVMTASGCGVMVKEYGEILQYDPDYAAKAARVSAMAKDIGEILQAEDLSELTPSKQKIAYQSPCTLQHGQKLPGLVESLLRQIGFQLLPVSDAHLCCGSAGVYSLLQPELSAQLLSNKLAALEENRPDLIATANIGCLTHLQSGSAIKVVHWIELLT